MKTFELNGDYHGMRVDGVGKCFTQTSFRDFVFRMYQKSPNLVRKEIKVTRERQIMRIFLALLDRAPNSFLRPLPGWLQAILETIPNPKTKETTQNINSETTWLTESRMCRR